MTFELGGFQTVEADAAGRGSDNAAVDVMMSPGGVTEEVTVVGEAQPFVKTAQVATNFKQDLMSTLPSNRTIDAVVLMAPVCPCDRSARRVLHFRRAVVREPLHAERRGHHREPSRHAITLYIEDALQEVTVASAGVSAEYGRFAGGMASAVTKSGGNNFTARSGLRLRTTVGVGLRRSSRRSSMRESERCS